MRMADSKLKIDIRRNAIIDRLRRDERVYVSELSRALGVTTVTVRNDLAALERDGYLIRMNGGAVYSNRNVDKHELSSPHSVPCLKEKEAIARAIGGIIKDGDTLFINSGTTTQLIAAELKRHNSLNIVTNSLSVAISLGAIASFRVILLGGEINSQYAFTYGTDAQEKLSHYHADWAILSVDGIGVTNGITTHHAEEAMLDRMMISGAASVIIAADHTKIGRTGFMRVCECSEGIHLVTDKFDDSSHELAAIKKCGITVTEA